jgi:GH24 family phage-related lysozyme (muramidase)
MQPAIDLITEFEGFSSKAYPDPLSGGEPWTIGYGSTYVNGKKVRRGDVITKEQAMAEVRRELAKIEATLSKRIPYWAEMTSGQRGALLSFAWNLGANFYGSEGFYSLTRALQTKAWSTVPALLERYRNPGSAVEAGLRRRRIAEGRVWQRPATRVG